MIRAESCWNTTAGFSIIGKLPPCLSVASVSDPPERRNRFPEPESIPLIRSGVSYETGSACRRQDPQRDVLQDPPRRLDRRESSRPDVRRVEDVSSVCNGGVSRLTRRNWLLRHRHRGFHPPNRPRSPHPPNRLRSPSHQPVRPLPHRLRRL